MCLSYDTFERLEASNRLGVHSPFANLLLLLNREDRYNHLNIQEFIDKSSDACAQI